MSDHFDPYHVWLGIPPEETAGGKPNHYRLLGLRLFEGNPDVISNAVDQRLVYLRSVQAGKRSAQSQRLLNEVSAASVCLLDEAKKSRYDTELRQQLSPPMPALSVAAPQSPPPAIASAPSPLYAQQVATPAAGTPLVTRGRKTPSSSTVVIGALVASCAGTVLLLIAIGAWWAMTHRRPAAIVAQPAETGGDQQPVASSADNRAQPPTPSLPSAAASNSSSTSGNNRDVAGSAPPRPADAATTAPLAATSATSASTIPPEAPAIRTRQRVALAFPGPQRVDVPLPLAMQSSKDDFTIELWLRWDRYEPRGALLRCGLLRLNGTLRDSSERGVNPPFNDLELGVGVASAVGGSDIKPADWAHIAIMRSGEQLYEAVNGTIRGQVKLPGDFSLAPALRLGSPSDQEPTMPPFSGHVRDLRVSRGCRYDTSGRAFTPDAKFMLDSQTIVLLNLEGPRQVGAPIQNLAGATPGTMIPSARLLPLTDDGQIAGERPDGTVDLLQAMSAALGTVEGDNTQTTSHLETNIAQGNSRVAIPYRPPAEYDVELDLSRLDGQGGAFVGLEIGGRPTIVALDCFPDVGRRTGIVPADLRRVIGIPVMGNRTPLFAAGGTTRVTLKARIQGSGYRLEIQRQGSTTSTGGSLRLLGVPPEFAIPMGHGMSLGSIDAKIRFDRVILRPVSTEFSPQALAVMQGAPPSTSPVRKSATAAAPPSPILTVSRRPPPDSETLAKAIEEARKIYEADFKSATKAPQKAALARRILETGKGTQNDPTARYVLLDLARKVFAQAGEVQDAMTTARLLESEYEIPRDELLTATIEALDDATLSADARGELAKAAADLADASIDAEQYERADKLSTIASQSAAKQRDAEVKKEIAQRRARVVRVVKDWTAVKPSLEKLKTEPTDAAANLAAGKFYCFTLDDFNEGLKHLAAGGETQLAEAAKQDLAAQGGDASKRLEAATAWQQAGAKISDRDDKLAVQRREKWLLQQAVGSLSGLDQIKANKRLDELKDVGQPSAKTAATSGPPRGASGRRTVSLIGRLVNGNTDSGLLITYEHGYFITNDDFSRLLSAAGITSSSNLKVGLVGGFFLPVDQAVSLHHSGSSNNGGTYRVFIDNRQYATVGAGYPSNSTTNIRVKAGGHLIRWEWTGGEFGTAELKLESDPAVTGGASVLIPISVDRSLESAARQSPTKATIHLGR